jgi:ParB family chromosome partitioning protein
MIPHLKELKDIPLGDLVVGKGQVRVKDVGKEIEELAESIRAVGLLQPIVVCPAEQKGKFEILAGQRRFLAHKVLKKATIRAAVLESRIGPTEAKALSLIENLVRRSISSKELIDACTSLFLHYGSMKAVGEELGLSERVVSQYVKGARLSAPLKDLVEKREITLETALRATDAASVSGKIDQKEALALAKEMAQMSGVQQKRIIKERESDPERPIEDVIEAAKSSEKLVQVIATLSAATHRSLQAYAADDGINQDEAAATLIEEGLKSKGFEA